MEVGWKFECLRDGNFPKGLPGCGFMRYVLDPNMVCYITRGSSKISVLSALIETCSLSNE